MASVKVKLNMAGIAAIKRQPGVEADLMRRAQRIADKATADARANGHEKAQWFPDVHSHHTLRGGCVAHVWPNMAAALDHNENRTLTSAIDQGR